MYLIASVHLCKHKHSLSLAMENNFILIYFTSFVYFLSKSAKTFSDKDIHFLHKLLAYNFMFACILSEDLL